MTTPIEQDERLGLSSASVAEREFHCPGSRAACKLVPKKAAEAIAIEGTLIHEALLKNNVDELDSEQRNIFDEIVAKVQVALTDWIEGIVRKEATLDERSEKRLWFHSPSGDKITSAQLDRFWIAGNNGLVIDFKTGFLSPTPSARNHQLRVQAACLAQNFRVNHVRVGTIHSRLKTVYDFCDYNKDDLDFARQELIFSHWRAEQEDAPRSAGHWCQYCPAKGFCKEASVWSLMPQKMAASIAETVDQLPLEALAYIESRRNIAEKVFEAVKERLKTFSIGELNAVGLDRTKDSEVIKISNASGAGIMLKKEKLITDEELWSCTSLVLGKLEEIILPRYAEREGSTQKVAKAALREILEPYVTKDIRSGHLIALKPVKQIN